MGKPRHSGNLHGFALSQAVAVDHPDIAGIDRQGKALLQDTAARPVDALHKMKLIFRPPAMLQYQKPTGNNAVAFLFAAPAIESESGCRKWRLPRKAKAIPQRYHTGAASPSRTSALRIPLKLFAPPRGHRRRRINTQRTPKRSAADSPISRPQIGHFDCPVRCVRDD